MRHNSKKTNIKNKKSDKSGCLDCCLFKNRMFRQLLWVPRSVQMMILILVICLIISFILLSISVFAHLNNTNNASVNNNDVLPNLSKYSLPIKQNQQQPSLIVVASINAGTSTLNQIFLYYFKHFYHGYKQIKDLYYWIACQPKEWINNIEKTTKTTHRDTKSFAEFYELALNDNDYQFNQWNVNFDNLIWNGCATPNNFHCTITCDHQDYMDHIGYKRTVNKWNDYFYNNYLSEISVSENNNNKYPMENDNEIFYFWDRTSGYNSLPYIPPILSANYPDSKLLYVVREPISQIYSRIRLFDEWTEQLRDKKDIKSEEANRRFNKLLKFIESDVYTPLLPLLKEQNQTDEIENKIISWYVALWSKYGIQWKDKRIFDICPYINILLFIKSGIYYNKVNKYNNFKLIQFESATSNLLIASIYIYCWTVYDEVDYGNNCVGKYTQNGYSNLDEIMFNWKELEANSHYGKLKSYHWEFTDVNIFDKLVNFFEICDQRLLGLIEKYPGIVLGQKTFNIDLWNDHRADLRKKMSSA